MEVGVFDLIVDPGDYVMQFSTESIRESSLDFVSAFADPSFEGDRRAIGGQVENFGCRVVRP